MSKDKHYKFEKYIDLCIDYGIDIENRVINFTGDLEEGYFSVFDFAMTHMEKASQAGIVIKINSFGGEVYELFAIIARMKESPRKITTKGYGKCMSAALTLLCSGDKRLMSKYAWGMHHPVLYGIPTDSHPLQKEFIKQADREEEFRLRFMADHSTITYSAWKKLTKIADSYLTPDKCLEIGIVDQLF